MVQTLVSMKNLRSSGFRKTVNTCCSRETFPERFFLLIGVALLAVFSAAYLHRAVMLRISIKSFEKARHEQMRKSSVEEKISAEEVTPAAEPIQQAGSPLRQAETPDLRNHAPAPVPVVRERSDIPLGMLRIPKIHLEVPVLSGTDEITLNRGVGRISGTSAPGEAGNVGIAGHRDGFFRNLKDINRGDEIELETTSASATYVVNRILITGSDDTSVLQSSHKPMLTLVTCYPFHFIGPAPRRFVVQDTLK